MSSVCLSVGPSVCLSVCLPACLAGGRSVRRSVGLSVSVRLSVCLCVCVAVCMYVCTYACMYVCTSVCMYVRVGARVNVTTYVICVCRETKRVSVNRQEYSLYIYIYTERGFWIEPVWKHRHSQGAPKCKGTSPAPPACDHRPGIEGSVVFEHGQGGESTPHGLLAYTRPVGTWVSCRHTTADRPTGSYGAAWVARTTPAAKDGATLAKATGTTRSGCRTSGRLASAPPARSTRTDLFPPWTT